MNSVSIIQQRIVALDPGSRGFGFVVLEGPQNLIDWGVKATRQDKRAQTLRKVTDLIRQYHPELIVLEHPTGNGSRRCQRVQKLIKAVCVLAARRHLKTATFSCAQIRRTFAGQNGTTKNDIAAATARRFPELAPLVPPHRKPWMSEDYRMAIFDAASLAVTYFHSRGLRTRSALQPS